MIIQLSQAGLRRLKAGPFELEWENEVKKIRESLATQIPAKEKEAASPAEGDLVEQLRPIWQKDPSLAVLKAFSLVEAELRRIVTDVEPLDGGKSPERMSARQLSLLALEHELITSESANAVQGLSILRNLAAYGQAEQLDQTRAIDYLHLTEALLYALRTKA